MPFLSDDAPMLPRQDSTLARRNVLLADLVGLSLKVKLLGLDFAYDVLYQNTVNDLNV